RSAWAVAGVSSTASYPPRAVDDGFDSADAPQAVSGRRFRVARRPCVLGGRLLAERHHAGAIGVVVGARSLLNHGLREAERLRRAKGSPHRLVITWRAHRALFRGALVKAIRGRTGGLSMPYTRRRVHASDLRTPWTSCPSGGRLLAAHDGNDPSRTQHSRRG